MKNWIEIKLSLMSEPGYSVLASDFSGENERGIILLEQIIQKLDEEETEKKRELENIRKLQVWAAEEVKDLQKLPRF